MAHDGARRRDEADALAAIFGADFVATTDSEWAFVYRAPGQAKDAAGEAPALAQLTCFLPEDYPQRSPPVLVLECARVGDAEREARCQAWLEAFEPDVEFGMGLAELFFERCAELHAAEGDGAPPPIAVDLGAGAASADGAAAEDVPLSATAVVGADVEPQILASLAETAGFTRYTGSLFVHGELGLAVELRRSDATHAEEAEEVEVVVSVDGLDTDDVVGWLQGRLEQTAGDQREFGPALLRWTEQQRASAEARYGSADGIADDTAIGAGAPSDSTLHGGTLTGNAAWKARLQAGETVAFRGGGNSLHPRIKSGECCKYAPVFSHDDVKEKDIVFCQIRGRYWGHMVKKKTFVGGRDGYEYTISNIHGWENGTIPIQNIYGKVIDHWK